MAELFSWRIVETSLAQPPSPLIHIGPGLPISSFPGPAMAKGPGLVISSQGWRVQPANPFARFERYHRLVCSIYPIDLSQASLLAASDRASLGFGVLLRNVFVPSVFKIFCIAATRRTFFPPLVFLLLDKIHVRTHLMEKGVGKGHT